ncbi:MAG TPA: hypothetical protein P5514_12415 [Bacteroidales bacterium]|nr:hypothetical protein [Bacteroidales bacterium]HRX97742.1 hypothetical protein [Bacteroidales bacterium]
MPAQSFEIKTSPAVLERIKAKKIKNIWFIPGSMKNGYYRIGSWYPTSEQAKVHVKRAIPKVIFKGESQNSSVKNYPNPDLPATEYSEQGGSGNSKALLAGGTIAGLLTLGFVFRKKLAKLIKR